MAGGTDIQGVVGDGGGGGGAFAEFRVLGDHGRFVGAGFQDGDDAVIQRSEVNVPVGGHRGGVITALGGHALLHVDVLARLGIVGGDQAAVLHHDILPLVDEG